MNAESPIDKGEFIVEKRQKTRDKLEELGESS